MARGSWVGVLFPRLSKRLLLRYDTMAHAAGGRGDIIAPYDTKHHVCILCTYKKVLLPSTRQLNYRPDPLRTALPLPYRGQMDSTCKLFVPKKPDCGSQRLKQDGVRLRYPLLMGGNRAPSHVTLEAIFYYKIRL